MPMKLEDKKRLNSSPNQKENKSKKMKNSHGKLHAINCRIPQETADEMAILLKVTSKSIAIFVRDAIETYMAAVKSPDGSKPHSLKIDQFVWRLPSKK